MTDLYYWITRNDHKIRMFPREGRVRPLSTGQCTTTCGSRVVDVTAAVSAARLPREPFGQTASGVR
jgi:hypothetical protein